MQELLRMEHISKRFGSFYANRDISLQVNRGEVLTLLGENGAGKSTLMNILIGLYQPTEGKIFLNGREVRIESPSQAVKLGIGMVHQHFMLVEAMTVFDNIILGDKHAKGLFIDRAARRKEIETLSKKYGLDVQLDKLITEISVGEQQRTEILKALYHGAELLILDEPSAALTDIEVEGLFAIMQKLISEGKSIIFISHKMREVLRISDRITVLRLGRVIGTVNRADTDGQKLAAQLRGDLYPGAHPCIRAVVIDDLDVLGLGRAGHDARDGFKDRAAVRIRPLVQRDIHLAGRDDVVRHGLRVEVRKRTQRGYGGKYHQQRRDQDFTLHKHCSPLYHSARTWRAKLFSVFRFPQGI